MEIIVGTEEEKANNRPTKRPYTSGLNWVRMSTLKLLRIPYINTISEHLSIVDFLILKLSLDFSAYANDYHSDWDLALTLAFLKRLKRCV